MRFRNRCLLLAFAALLIVPSSFCQERYLGSIALVPYNFAPVGTALCQGQLLSIAQNSALFSLIGTTYGGDGIETFALPDLRGRVAIGEGQGPGLQNYTLGQIGGEESVTLTVNQLPAHTHTALASSSVANTVSPAGNYWGVGPRLLLYSAPTSLVAMAPTAVGFTGGSAPHENLKPFLTLNYVIWVEGIYPSQ